MVDFHFHVSFQGGRSNVTQTTHRICSVGKLLFNFSSKSEGESLRKRSHCSTSARAMDDFLKLNTWVEIEYGLHSVKLAYPLKDVGWETMLSFWEGLSSMAMLVLGRVKMIGLS